MIRIILASQPLGGLHLESSRVGTADHFHRIRPVPHELPKPVTSIKLQRRLLAAILRPYPMESAIFDRSAWKTELALEQSLIRQALDKAFDEMIAAGWIRDMGFHGDRKSVV